ncbi:hypothetical protein [Microbacterium sp. A93]|uniref:hypothetical protein n=1 Tax=Microbacterium sp. A93 TaxID=3450716 RepID=UPI003F431877
MTVLPVLLLGLGLALTALAILVYALVRLSGWSPDDGAPVTSARMHGFAMALIATLAVLFAVFLLQGLADGGLSTDGPQDGADARQGAEAVAAPAPPPDPVSAVLTAALPALLLLGIYAVAQHTWPRQTGPVRNARLVARRTLDYVPGPLLWVSVGSGLVAVAVVVVSWSTPGVDALYLSYVTQNHTMGTYTAGSRPGTAFAPYLVLALALLAAATWAATVLMARRPSLTGLSPAADDAVRRLAVHRILRTASAATLAVAAVATSSWAQGLRGHAHRTRYGDLEELAQEYAAGITAPAPDLSPAIELLVYGIPLAALAGMLVLLLWRPAALHDIRAAKVSSP